ncbi:UNVERIFIED_CONTAM: hypothetical protein GTU68_064107, partial [Idotea baltica]|nr:hypothetical protein [Idotea baltica]
GLEEGSSQTTRRSEDERDIFVWNFPLDVTFKASSPFGWPQLVISIYGTDFFGNDVVRGYAVCHLPTFPGRVTKKLTAFAPDSASTLQRFVSLLSGRRPEFVSPKTIARGAGRE